MTIHAEKFFRKFLKPSMCSSGNPYFTSAPSSTRSKHSSQTWRARIVDPVNPFPTTNVGETYGNNGYRQPTRGIILLRPRLSRDPNILAGSDHTLHVGPLPWRPRRSEHFFDLHDGDLLAKRMPINAISIPQQIFRCQIKREGFQNLPRRPFGRRMRRNVKVHQASTIMLDHDKHE